MLHHLELNEFLKLALIKQDEDSSEIKRIAVFSEIMADKLTPVAIFEALSSQLKEGAILESGLEQAHTGRYSFLAFEPLAQLQFIHDKVIQTSNELTRSLNTNPFTQLRELMSEINCTCKDELSTIISQAMGFITYDAVRLFEEIPDRHSVDKDLPEILFNFYRTTLCFDHQRQSLLISEIVELSDDPSQDYAKTQEKINSIINTINSNSQNAGSNKSSNPLNSNEEADITDTDFIRLVEKAQVYIKQGDAFQIVLSRCFKKAYSAKAFDIYRALRQISPAPYMFYFPIGDRVIVGASPERMIGVQNGKISINPIAGTRARLDKNHDQAIENELLNDPKELAEHRMLVDLARNDLGKICEIGSIEVEEYARVKHYSHISHITSTVTGKLRRSLDAFDALTAAFPAGTLSGAPKIRAMQIIDELETSRRGLYGGAILRLDYAGNLDSCIAIRMAILQDGIATIRTGAGIVHDSDPETEAKETRQKASSILAAIHYSEGVN